MGNNEEHFDCTKSLTIKQITGTCWFNAILMSIFYSDGMRKLLIPRIKKWTKINSPKQIIKDLVLKHHINISDKHIKFFEKFKPEILLKELYLDNPEIFNFDPDKGEGYFAGRYFPKLLKYLDITDIVLLDSIKSPDGKSYNTLFYSQHNIIKDQKNPMQKIFGKPSSKEETEKYLAKTPEVLIIMTKKESDIQFYPEHYYKSTLRFTPQIIYNGVEYIADSLLLANFNQQQCKKGHEIAGVTCNKKRYMYNGWTSQTVDTGISGELKQKIPCSLMPHDWLDYKKSGFCIDRKKCDLFYHDNDKIKMSQLCFSYTQGPRIFTYIRKNLIEDKISKVTSKKIIPIIHIPLVIIPKKIITIKPKPQITPIKNKECPEDKILNPLTNRCVKKNSLIGKTLLKEGKSINANIKIEKTISCPPDKILNPKTGRCVNKKGKVGKDLLK